MDHHSSISIDQLISAAKFIEQATIKPANPVLSANYLENNQEQSRDTFMGKQRVLARRACPNASTSALGCSDSRSSGSSSSEEYGRPYPSVSTRHSRAAHNELEKTRRANLRGYLDKLKDIVPVGSDSARNTTLSLLTRARDYITELEQKRCKAEAEKARLKERQAELKRLIEKAQQKVQVGRPESASTISAVDENEPCPASPVYLEYSPSAKPNGSPSYLRTPPVDPYLDGLLPALPLCYPRISMYPYLDVKSHPTLNNSFLPVETALL